MNCWLRALDAAEEGKSEVGFRCNVLAREGPKSARATSEKRS